MMRRAGSLLLPVRDAWETNANANAVQSTPAYSDKHASFAISG
jgi:hypothetical protein